MRPRAWARRPQDCTAPPPPPSAKQRQLERQIRVLELFGADDVRELYSVEVVRRADCTGIRSTSGALSVLYTLQARGALSSRLEGSPISGLGRRYFRATDEAPAILEELRAQAQRQWRTQAHETRR